MAGLGDCKLSLHGQGGPSSACRCMGKVAPLPPFGHLLPVGEGFCQANGVLIVYDLRGASTGGQWKSPARARPVGVGSWARCEGGPVATISPPFDPPWGPSSMIQSAAWRRERRCSIAMMEWPTAIKRL